MNQMMGFRGVSGLRVNYIKSRVIALGMNKRYSKAVQEIFRFPWLETTINFFGIPINSHLEKVCNENAKPLNKIKQFTIIII